MPKFSLYLGDCRGILSQVADNSIDSVVTDPPYELGFMGKAWDSSGVANDVATWQEVFRVLKPGGHLLAFSHARTYHRMACAIEDADFEVRDQLMWLYGSGKPKSTDISKAIDKNGGVVLDWFGPWLREERKARNLNSREVERLMALVPGGKGGAVRNWELGYSLPNPQQFNTVCKALQLPFDSIEVLERAVVGKAKHHTHLAQMHPGAEHTGYEVRDITAPAHEEAKKWHGWGTGLKPAHEPICLARKPFESTTANNVLTYGTGALNIDGSKVDGGWPSNVMHDGLPETWSRYFYCPKATAKDKGPDNNHPTVKPTDLMQYLCRLITPPGGLVLDPFMGSGSTGKAAIRSGYDFLGIDLTPEYVELARRRIEKEL